MPGRLHLSSTTKAAMKEIYPDVNFERIKFYLGLPWFVKLFGGGPKGGITLGNSIYVNYVNAPLIVHELYHAVVQKAAGFGPWFLRPFYLRWVIGYFSSGFEAGHKNPMEKPAYEFVDELKRLGKI